MAKEVINLKITLSRKRNEAIDSNSVIELVQMALDDGTRTVEVEEIV